MIPGFKKTRFPKNHIPLGENSILLQLKSLSYILAIVLIMHIYAMVHFENLSFGDAVWLTLTSATTVGYGDLSAETTAGRIATVILLYVGGIAILAQIMALYFEYNQEVRERKLKGNWSWNMEDHIVFLNCPQEVDDEYFYQAISGLRKSGTKIANLPIIIVCEYLKDGLSTRLRELNVAHISRPLSQTETLHDASVLKAHTIVILSRNRHDTASDGMNFELVYRLREMQVNAHIIVEAVKDDNRTRLKKIGANNVLRPIRTYPELLMRAIISPGSEQVLETLFDSNAEECVRYNVDISMKWIDIVQKILVKDYGIAIAYEDKNGQVKNCPNAHEMISAQALFVIAREGFVQDDKEIANILSANA